jgi:hypothetical protein
MTDAQVLPMIEGFFAQVFAEDSETLRTWEVHA